MILTMISTIHFISKSKKIFAYLVECNTKMTQGWQVESLQKYLTKTKNQRKTICVNLKKFKIACLHKWKKLSKTYHRLKVHYKKSNKCIIIVKVKKNIFSIQKNKIDNNGGLSQQECWFS